MTAPDRQAFWRWLVVGIVALGLGFALKVPCLTSTWDGLQYSTMCYSDVQALHAARGLDAEPEPAVPYIERFNEYPTGTGTIMYAAARVAASHTVYTVVGFAILFLWGLTAIAATAGAAPASAWRFAAAPSLVLLGFISWDLVAVGFAAVGLWFASRTAGRKYLLAGIALGLGAAVKLYPVFLLPALVLVPWPFIGRAARRGTVDEIRERVVPLVAGFVGAWAIVNLPVLIASPDGWFETWRFHTARLADFDTLWFWASRLVPGIDNGETLRLVADWVQRLGVLLAAAVFVAAANRSLRRDVQVDVARAAAGLGTVLVFLLLSKVYSPQYGLWLLPLFALVAVPWRWWGVYEVLVVALLVVRYRWFLTAPDLESNAWSALFGVTVVARWLVLAGLCAMLLRPDRLKRWSKERTTAPRKSSTEEILRLGA